MNKESVPRNARSVKICSVGNCLERCAGNGLCRKHYMRVWKHGDVNYSSKNVGVGKTREERFWSRVAITANPEKCWEWQGGKMDGGYGSLHWDGIGTGAHRVAFELFYGYKPKLHVLHSCDNPPCCNPHHLREGTDADNAQDKKERGRDLCGSKNPNSALTETEVDKIRQLLAAGQKGYEIAKEFGVAKATISRIKTGKLWTN